VLVFVAASNDFVAKRHANVRLLTCAKATMLWNALDDIVIQHVIDCKRESSTGSREVHSHPSLPAMAMSHEFVTNRQENLCLPVYAKMTVLGKVLNDTLI
jgi:hypothetical protein